MKHRITALCVLSLTLMLTGCVQYKWVKPGVSDAEMNKKLTECEAQALIDLPPDNVVTGSSSEKMDKSKKKKDISRKMKYMKRRIGLSSLMKQVS